MGAILTEWLCIAASFRMRNVPGIQRLHASPMRLAAMNALQVIYVSPMTAWHGETPDSPTVEQLIGLRSIPGM